MRSRVLADADLHDSLCMPRVSGSFSRLQVRHWQQSSLSTVFPGLWKCTGCSPDKQAGFQHCPDVQCTQVRMLTLHRVSSACQPQCRQT